MKSLTALVTTSFILVLLLTLSALKTEQGPPDDDQVKDSLAEDRAKYVKMVRASIKGNERRPADSVFKNIQTFKGVPAGRLVAIMDIGYSQSLGVSCGHCHDTNKWESEEKPQKQIAREMSVMAGKTRDLLAGIQGLSSKSPTINCTTCHRGSLKPALELSQK